MHQLFLFLKTDEMSTLNENANVMSWWVYMRVEKYGMVILSEIQQTI